MTVRTVAESVFAAPDIGFLRPLDVVCNHQIEPPVFIVIKPAGTGRPSSQVGDTCLGGHIGEGPIAIVVVKDGAAVAGHVQIGIAIVIEVADGNPLTVMAFASYTGLFGDVGESPIAVVVIKRAV